MKKMYTGLATMIVKVPALLSDISNCLGDILGKVGSIEARLDGLASALDTDDHNELYKERRKEFKPDDELVTPIHVRSIPHLTLGTDETGYFIYGGPYAQKPDDIYGVNMAAEIKKFATIRIPTKDFCIPQVLHVELALWKAFVILKAEGELYVGCMGGIGRTGLFMALMTKVWMEMQGTLHDRERRGDQAIAYVRDVYNKRAVETTEQKDYVREFDVELIGDMLRTSRLFS